jgi:TolA-binding protein
VKTSTCPSSIQLSKEISEGLNENTQAHLAECDSCLGTWNSIKQVVELGQELPGGQPDSARKEAVRNAVLTRAATEFVPRTRWRKSWLAVAAAASIAVITSVFFAMGQGGNDLESESSSDPAYHGLVHKNGEAKFFHTISKADTLDEIVRITYGKVNVNVTPLKDGERFLVVTGDAEIEVRGTSFDVNVEEDLLVSVRVFSGKVEVRPEEGEHVLLTAGERWRRPKVESSTPPTIDKEPPMIAEANVEKEKENPRAEEVPRAIMKVSHNLEQEIIETDEEIEETADEIADEIADETADEVPEEAPNETRQNQFELGFKALRDGQPHTAAKHFERSIEMDKDGALAEDASFWRAVAYTRSGMNSEATKALNYHLKKYPNSPRAGEASTMLGWRLLKAGDMVRAQELFESARDDKVARVRQSANKGLEAVQKKRATE